MFSFLLFLNVLSHDLLLILIKNLYKIFKSNETNRDKNIHKKLY